MLFATIVMTRTFHEATYSVDFLLFKNFILFRKFDVFCWCCLVALSCSPTPIFSSFFFFNLIILIRTQLPLFKRCLLNCNCHLHSGLRITKLLVLLVLVYTLGHLFFVLLDPSYTEGLFHVSATTLAFQSLLSMYIFSFAVVAEKASKRPPTRLASWNATSLLLWNSY